MEPLFTAKLHSKAGLLNHRLSATVSCRPVRPVRKLAVRTNAQRPTTSSPAAKSGGMCLTRGLLVRRDTRQITNHGPQLRRCFGA